MLGFSLKFQQLEYNSNSLSHEGNTIAQLTGISFYKCFTADNKLVNSLVTVRDSLYSKNSIWEAHP